MKPHVSTSPADSPLNGGRGCFIPAHLIYDLAIGAGLLFFALRGRARGLVLSLCSLLAVVIALTGAFFLADTLTPIAAEFIVPPISSALERRFTGLLPFSAGDSDGDEAIDVPGGQSAEHTTDSDENPAEDAVRGLRQAMEALRLPPAALKSARETLCTLRGVEDIRSLPSRFSRAIAQSVSETVLYLIIFSLSFVLILLLWGAVSRALNLVARLPVLYFFNRTGGFLLGLCKGALFFFVAAWFVRRLGDVIPAGVVEDTYLLHFFMYTDPLRVIAVFGKMS